MDMSRARQIISSPQNTDVFYQGSYVWIERLNERDGTADITNMETHTSENVPVSLLFELY